MPENFPQVELQRDGAAFTVQLCLTTKNVQLQWWVIFAVSIHPWIWICSSYPRKHISAEFFSVQNLSPKILRSVSFDFKVFITQVIFKKTYRQKHAFAVGGTNLLSDLSNTPFYIFQHGSSIQSSEVLLDWHMIPSTVLSVFGSPFSTKVDSLLEKIFSPRQPRLAISK